MHAPRLKKWAAIIDHRDFIRRRACNPQLNHAQYHTHERNVYAVYPSRQFVDAKIKRFVDALKVHVGDQLDSYAKELGMATTTEGSADSL